MDYLIRTRGHYDRSTLIDKRRDFMEWWSKILIDQKFNLSHNRLNHEL